MEVRIGVQNVSREISLETEQSAEEISAAVAKAISSGEQLLLNDSKGGQIIIPAGVLGYVEIAADKARKVGFAVS